MIRGLFTIMLCGLAAGLAWADNAVEKGQAIQHMVKAPEIDFEHLRDPFESYLAVMRQQAQQRSQQWKSDHPREPLEAFDLSTLKLVAIFSMGKKQVAMVEDSTGKGYVVRVGSYMGTSSGRVTKITKDSLILTEKTIAPTGEIVNREVTLTLKEVNEPNQP